MAIIIKCCVLGNCIGTFAPKKTTEDFDIVEMHWNIRLCNEQCNMRLKLCMCMSVQFIWVQELLLDL